MDVAIIGAGSMARGIGTRVLAGGHSLDVVHADKDKGGALAAQLTAAAGAAATVRTATLGQPLTAEVVVLAVPYEAVSSVVQTYDQDLQGRVVVDISNPVDWETLDRLVTPPDTSAAEQTAALVPDGTHVLKAFNTTFAQTLVDGMVAGHALDVFIAGDDEGAKRQIADLVTAGGLRSVDVGELRRARELETMQLLHIHLQRSLGTGYGSTLKLLP